MMITDELKDVARVIRENNSFAIYTHINTDFDAVASSLSFRAMLQKLGKLGHIFIHSGFPSNIDALKGVEVINSQKLPTYDVAVILDCNDDKRIGKYVYSYRKKAKTIINIDHHFGQGKFARHYYTEQGGSSTCELVYNLIKYMGVELDKDLATNLISGIYTDTGSLQFSNVHASTLKAVAELLEVAGCEMDKITVPIFQSVTMPELELKKLCYNRLEFFEDGAIAMMMLSVSDFKALGANFEDTVGLVDIALQLKSVKLLALASEEPPEGGVFKVSIRAKAGFNAVNVASAFGGGGHIRAAGCKIAGELGNVKKQILDQLIKEYKRPC